MNRNHFKSGAWLCSLAMLFALGGCKNSPQPPTSPSAAESESTSDLGQSATKETKAEQERQEKVLIKDINSVSAGVSETTPDINIEAVDGIKIENSAGKGDGKGLLRLPLPTAILPDEVVSAEVRLKRQSGDNAELRAVALGSHWDRLDVTWNSIQEDLLTGTTTEIGAFGEDDWYVLDITGIVKDWLSGKYGNSGILLEEMQKEASTIFHSPYTETPDDCPELVITYAESEKENYGTFVYAPQEDGNCLSFALRDTDAILFEDLGIETKMLQQKFNNGGSDEALEYIKDLTQTYVETHADVLKISSFRELTAFDEEIDPDTEYRIALRIGIETQEGLEDLPNTRNSFDYHLQVQLTDGSWGEKFGAAASRIVPGSNAVLNPGLVPWDQNEIWGMSKFSAYYDSKTIYYAVRKDTAEFTAHLQ